MRENLKRIAALLLAAIMLAGFVGCSPRINLDDDYDWDRYEDDDEQMYVTTTGDSCTTILPATEHTHVYSDATCTDAATCFCGDIFGSALGHDWIEATCKAPMTCARCGITNGSYGSHSWLPATYTSPKRCVVCGKTSGSKLEAVCTGISVATARTEYAFGEDSFDYDKLSVNMDYSDGSYRVINGSECKVVGFSSAKLGKSTVTISYDGFSAKLEVEILEQDINVLKMAVFNVIDASSPHGQDLITRAYDVYDSYGVYYDECYRINALSGALVDLSPSIVFRTGGHFDRFTGTIVIPEDTYNAVIKIYADDVLIYSKNNIDKSMASFQIDIDVTDCEFVQIQVSNDPLLIHNAYFKT